MSLYSVVQAETDLIITSNLDSSPTEFFCKNGITGTSTLTGSVTQSSESLTGNYSYIFDGNDQIILSTSSGLGTTGDIALEVVFKKSGNIASGGETIVRRRGGSTSGDGSSIYLNYDGTLTGRITGYNGSTSSITTTGTYNDGKFHHVVLLWKQYNYFRLYVDGVLAGTASANVANIGSGYIVLGATRSQSGSQAFSQYFNGSIDFFATYNPAPNNDSSADTFVANHVAEFANRTVSVDVMNATTALFVQPTVTIIRNVNYSADPSTASALMTDTQVSNFDEPRTLLTYIDSINPEHYIRFKDVDFKNEIPGGTDTFTIIGSPIFKQVSGISTEPSVILNDVTGYGTPNSGEWRPQNPGGNLSQFGQNFYDDDVSMGFWFKTTGSDCLIFEAFEFSFETFQPVGGINYRLRVDADGYANINLEFDDTVNEVIVGHGLLSNDPINDGEWHFLAFSFDGERLDFYVDGVSQGYIIDLDTVGTRSVMNTLSFGGQSDNEWASLIQGPASLITSQVAEDIWNIGTANFQAQSYMIDPVVKISTAFYDKVEAYEAVLSYKFDASGTPLSSINNDYATVGESSSFNGSNITYGYQAKNVNAYRIQDTVSHWNGVYNTPSGTFTTNNEWSLSALVKVDPTKLGGTPNEYYGPVRNFAIISGNGTGDIALGYNDDNWIAYASEEGYATELIITSTSAIDDKWHLLTATFDGTYFKLYVDGVEEASEDTSTYYANTAYHTVDAGTIFIGGGENFYFGMGSTTDVDKIIDHVGLFDFALSAQENFELWQSVGINPMLASNATFVLPVGVAGYGPTIHPGVMYASTLLVDPTQQDTVAPTILPMTAFIDTVTPNFAATSTATIAADPMTASGVFHMPQWQIGENNSVDHMNASAQMGDHRALIPGFWNANPMIANPVVMVMPGFASTQGGLVLAQPMIATAASVLPPAYKSLFDDKWYDLLYSQHSVRHNFRVPNGGNGEAILKLFDDVTTDKAANSTIKNNLTYTITTDGLVVDTAEPEMKVVAEFRPSTNTPLLGIGYFDDYQRKAVKFNNITTGYENSEFINTSFSFELSIKTTKSDQIIAFGKTSSYYGYSGFTTTLGISDGKLFINTTSARGPAPILHYKQPGGTNGFIGNKRIDDGQWHHIVIQYGWDDNRIQFWIDGDLDIQRIRGLRLDGLSFLGFNSQSPTYASDFLTSAWSYDSHAFPRELEIDNHRYAYIKYEPVRAEPMIASATSGDHLAKGNRARALMLYWWPTDTFQGAPYPARFDAGGLSGSPTFDASLTTADFIKSGPQEYYGWDIFPVDISGLYVSDLVKPEAYGGKQNIVKGSKPFIGTGQNYNTNPEYLYNIEGSFKDPITDARRYIDVVNDIDLRNFDAIFFRNFPDESVERDEFTGSQSVDNYFGSKEVELYDAFIKSLRAAVDTGISLYVTNYQLALDLGIVDRVETVPDMDELIGYDSDPYSPTIAPGNASNLVIQNASQWYDSYKNNRLRVVNTLEGFTTEPSFIRTDYIYYRADDANSFGEPNRSFNRFVYRPNGLQVGDEFIIANDLPGGARTFYAVPFANVKAGTVITAFANTVKRRTETITNPYANYATCIVVQPGDVLKGTQCGGKIVVNFTENLNGAYDSGDVDLVSDYWINIAYNDGFIDAATRNTYLNASYNIDRQLEDPNSELTQEEYNKLAFWSSNGMNIITNATLIDDPTESRPRDGLGDGTRSAIVTKTRKSGTAYSAKVSTSSQWFSFAYAWKYPRMGIKVPNILTRGFWWLSNRESYDGIVERPLAATASATLPMPIVTGQKDRSINVQAMIASGRIVQAEGTSPVDVSYAPLPMTANGTMGNIEKRYIATPMTASAILRTNNRIFTTAVDEVVVYVMHTDPILYIREDVIK